MLGLVLYLLSLHTVSGVLIQKLTFTSPTTGCTQTLLYSLIAKDGQGNPIAIINPDYLGTPLPEGDSPLPVIKYTECTFTQ